VFSVTSQLTVKTLEKALLIVDLFLQETEPLSIGEIHRHLNMSKPTVSRLARVLESFGYLVKQDNNKYWLGTKILQLASVINEELELATLAKPAIKKLRDATNETVHLNVVENFERLCIYCLQGKGYLRGHVTVGHRSPLHIGASAKILLAFMSDSFINNYIDKFLRDNCGSAYIDELWTDINKIREMGYCVTVKERTQDSTGIGAPIRNASGAVIAAIAMTFPATRDEAVVSDFIAKTIEAAKEISASLGYSGE
jgi:DNA-binding IclR family transcriptional regulator